MKTESLNINISLAEKPHFRKLWGQRHLTHPKFIRAVLGDGGKLLIVTPINTRPDYYLIRVDSTWETDSTVEAPDHVCDHIDEIYEAIENQFGGNDEDSEERRPWPVLSADSGSTWGEVTGKELSDLLEVTP